MGILTENVSCTCCTEMVDFRKDGFFPKEDFLYKGWLTVKILMIEDDLGLNRGISFALAQEGYEVVTAENMEKGLRLFEKEHPEVLNGSRRKRIAAGSGTTIAEVNRLLKQFEDTRKVMRTFATAGGARNAMRAMGAMRKMHR